MITYGLQTMKYLNLRQLIQKSVYKKKSQILRYSDKINSISNKQEHESFEIGCESEADVIEEFVAEISKIDPDFIFTEDGDSFTFP